MTVGRNDPCPCGSGKKYKKCCYQKDALQRRITQHTRQVDDVLVPDATIYRVWYEWRKARSQSDFNFLFDLIAPSSPLANRFAHREAFVAACHRGTDDIHTGESAKFRHLSIIDSKSARLLQTVGDDDAARPTLRCECVHLLNTDQGWRFSNLETREIAKGEESSVSLALFDEEDAEGSEAVSPPRR